MPVFDQQSRDQLRQSWVDAWQKRCRMLPMTPLETQIADVIALHPEYHPLLDQAASAVQRDWHPEGGATNPFLHMSLHLAIREQVSTDRPTGIRAVHQTLQQQRGDAHGAEHAMIECLAEALWTAQRNRQPPDEQAYLQKLVALTRR